MGATGAAGVSAYLAKIADVGGISSTIDQLARINAILDRAGIDEQLAQYNSSLDSLNSSQLKNRPKNPDPGPSEESLLSSPDPVQEQPEVNEGGNNKKEHRE